MKKQLAAVSAVPTPFIDLVSVGNVANAPDQDFGDGPLGQVNYEFRIGRTEVTLAQYTAFLNAVAKTDAHGLYNPSMSTVLNSAGIAQSGSSGAFVYSVIGTGTRPVTFVSWFDAARFCNWLHNGRPAGAQTSATTERGAYTLDGATSGNLTITRNPGAKFWIPNENEWYKAAYHHPAGEGGDGDDYWLFATRSNSAPGNQIGGLPLANHANYIVGGNFSVTQETGPVATQNYLSEVGAFPGSPSFYGTFDQAGNVQEWVETVNPTFPAERCVRGGHWNRTDPNLLAASNPRSSDSRTPETQFATLGFRVASP